MQGYWFWLNWIGKDKFICIEQLVVQPPITRALCFEFQLSLLFSIIQLAFEFIEPQDHGTLIV